MKTTTLTPARRKALLKALVDSPTYRKAYQDIDFLAREELRPMRLQLELLKPEMILVENGIASTIIVFGSARILAPEDSLRALARLRRELARKPSDAALRESLAAAERLHGLSRYYEEARRFGRIVTKASQGKGKRHFVIVTGGGPGIMEAANRGAFDAKGKSIGLNITLPHEQEPNPFVTPELSFLFHYFAIRKMHFLMRAKAMVAFPGGFGTLDEIFETLTLVQTGKKARLPVILVGREFWTRVLDIQTLASEGVISPSDMDLIQMVDTAEEAWSAIRDYWRRNGMPHAHHRKTFFSHKASEDSRNS
ncbi:MAG: TIGR00730 family Rossman fold protein [Elusimicrobiota bacterium]|jgi:hypothetical protein